MIKIAKISEGIYRVDDNDMPVDLTIVRQIAENYGGLSNVEASKWLDELDVKNENQLEAKANTGVVVNIYEVDYPPPRNPNDATQEIAKNLDEYKDAVSQQIFPDSQTEDVVVDLRKNLQPQKNQKLHWQIEPTLETLEGLKAFIASMELNKNYKFPDYPYEAIELEFDNEDGYTWALDRNYKIIGSVGYVFPVAGNMVTFWKKRSSAERSLYNGLTWLYEEDTGQLSERWKKKRPRASKKSWRVKLGATEAPTKEVPTKKVPEKEAPPEKPERTNPFKKPNITPGQEPQPKAICWREKLQWNQMADFSIGTKVKFKEDTPAENRIFSYDDYESDDIEYIISTNEIGQVVGIPDENYDDVEVFFPKLEKYFKRIPLICYRGDLEIVNYLPDELNPRGNV